MLLCVHVPVFRLCVARRDCAVSPDRPAALTDKPDRGRVLECDEAAYALGVRAGQTALQAGAAAGGGLTFFVHDARRSRITWSDMLDALDAISPLVDDSGEGTAYLDMRGIAGRPQEWIDRSLAVLHGFDLPVRAAVGANKFLARAATYAPHEHFQRLPIEVLGLDTRVVERLQLLGVLRLEDLAKLPHGPLVRRFGKEAAVWHDRARGIDHTPLRPRAHELQIDAALFGEGSAQQEEQVYFALRVLAERICSDLSRAGRAAARVRMSFECEDGEVREMESGFAQATADPRTMLDVMRVKLEGCAFGSPITGLRLQAFELEECGVHATLFAQNEPDPQILAMTIARLQATNTHPPRRAQSRRSHRLETRFSYSPFSPQSQESKQFAVGSSSLTIARNFSMDGKIASDREGTTPNPKIPPQLRLLTVREVEVKMRGNRPSSVGARTVLDVAGPWRIDEGWFEEPIARDEYDVLLDDGMLCRIYRQGEHWYLRGAYD